MTSLIKSKENFDRLGQVGKINYMKKLGFAWNALDSYDFYGSERRFFRWLHRNNLIEQFINDFSHESAS